MKHLKGLQRKTLLASTLIVLISAPMTGPAGASTSDTSFGACTGTSGSDGNDCVTAVGHISASVVGTLSINEMRAISFGNFAVTCGAGTCLSSSSIDLGVDGTRVAVSAGGDTINLLNGENATGGSAGGAGRLETGSQSPGHYTVSFSAEAATTQVYISFADKLGNIVDACVPTSGTGGPHGGAGYAGAGIGTCDVYHPGNGVILQGPAGAHTFFVDRFRFNESGSDVFGHYIDNQASVGPEPVSGTPFLPGTGSGSGHNNGFGTPGDGNSPTDAIDVVVGATLHTVNGATYPAGKYTNTFDVMVSY